MEQLRQRLLNARASETCYRVMTKQLVNQRLVDVIVNITLQTNYREKTAFAVIENTHSNGEYVETMSIEGGKIISHVSEGKPCCNIFEDSELLSPISFDALFAMGGELMPIQMDLFTMVEESSPEGCCQDFTIAPNYSSRMMGYMDSKLTLCMRDEHSFYVYFTIIMMNKEGFEVPTEVEGTIEIKN